MNRHQDLYIHVSVHSDLTTQAKLAQHSIFFEAVVLHLAHFGFNRVELNSAGSATRVAAAPMADVVSRLFDGVSQFSAGFNFKFVMSANVHFVRWHSDENTRKAPSITGKLKTPSLSVIIAA